MKKTIFTLILFFMFIISPKAYELTISNSQNDNIKNTYTYNLNVYKASGAYKYKYNNDESYLVFDATGNATFTLKNNESITITNLPDSKYQIEQNTNNNYETYINNKKTVLYNGDIKNNNKITFINKTKKTTNPNTGTKEIIISITIILFIMLIILKNIKTRKYYEVK